MVVQVGFPISLLAICGDPYEWYDEPVNPRFYVNVQTLFVFSLKPKFYGSANFFPIKKKN